MTDEGSSASAPASDAAVPADSAPAAEPAPVEVAPTPEAPQTPVVEAAAEPAAAPQNTEAAPPEPAAIVTPEAVKEISSEITEVVQEVIMGEKPETHEVTPQMQNSEVSPPNSPAPKAPASATLAPEAPIKARRGEALAMRRAIKQERLKEIMRLAFDGELFSHDDAQDKLLIADSTVRSYLAELVRLGKLVKSGKGKGTRYRRA